MRVLQGVTNLAILIVCILPGYTLATHRTVHFGRTSAEVEEGALVGQTLPSLPGYSWKTHQKTLVLAIREGCGFCEASMPFYKRLADEERNGKSRAHILAVMPDNELRGSAALKTAGVEIQAIFGQNLDALRVRGTPTILLLNANGGIERAWYGKLAHQRENEVSAVMER